MTTTLYITLSAVVALDVGTSVRIEAHLVGGEKRSLIVICSCVKLALHSLSTTKVVFMLQL